MNFAATCFSLSINKCISHSQGLSKFIKAAGGAPGETDNPSFQLSDSQGEPMSNHRLLSALSPNLISSLSNYFVLTLSYCVKWKHFSLPLFLPFHFFLSYQIISPPPPPPPKITSLPCLILPSLLLIVIASFTFTWFLHFLLLLPLWLNTQAQTDIVLKLLVLLTDCMLPFVLCVAPQSCTKRQDKKKRRGKETVCIC